MRCLSPILSLLLSMMFVPPSLLGGEIRWGEDYAAGLKLAQEKQLPLLIEFRTPDCPWCDRLEESTFTAATVVQQIKNRFVPLRLDSRKNTRLIEYLGIQEYPTVVLATPAGKILDRHSGYLDAQGFLVFLRRSLSQVAEVAPPVGAPAERAGMSADPADERGTRARELLRQAREDLRTEQFLICLIRCETLLSRFPDLPEGNEASQMIAQITAQPERMTQVCDTIPEIGGMAFLRMAETKIKLGQPQQAVFYLERVVQAFPQSRHAELAQVRLSQIQGPPPVVPVSIEERNP